MPHLSSILSTQPREDFHVETTFRIWDVKRCERSVGGSVMVIMNHITVTEIKARNQNSEPDWWSCL